MACRSIVVSIQIIIILLTVNHVKFCLKIMSRMTSFSLSALLGYRGAVLLGQRAIAAPTLPLSNLIRSQRRLSLRHQCPYVNLRRYCRSRSCWCCQRRRWWDLSWWRDVPSNVYEKFAVQTRAVPPCYRCANQTRPLHTTLTLPHPFHHSASPPQRRASDVVMQ